MYLYVYIYVYIYIYIHISRVVDLPCLQQHFDDCVFQVSFCMDNFLLFTFYLSRFYMLHFFRIVARNILREIKND